MRAVVFAYHDPGCVGLKALLRHGVDVAAVFTHRDSPDEHVWFGSVAKLAASHGIPVYVPDDVNHALWVERIRALDPDMIFSFYYRQVLSPDILALAPQGAMNLHGSLLPRYRGRCPVNWAVLNGERETGVTLHDMVELPDAGPIIGQRAVPIEERDDVSVVFGRVVEAAEALLDETLPAILAGTAPRVPQDESSATYFGGRRPEDGEIDWSRPASDVANLVRAVTHPYPGAFTFAGDRKILIWEAAPDDSDDTTPADTTGSGGLVLSVDPLRIACGDGRAIRVARGEAEGGVCVSGRQLASDLHLVEGIRLGPHAGRTIAAARKKRVLILGANGFIGNAIVKSLLDRGGYEVFGMDLWSDNLADVVGRPGFEFCEGDIAVNREWVEYHVRKCDIVLPLVAIATPIEYIRNPLRVFELDFEENLRIVRYCARHGKRVVFPSTSEVYGMCHDTEFDEDNSPLVLGPIRMQRWIYSCSKQLLDRVIWAYGEQGLQFTLFRPFNWIGPRLDRLDSARVGSSRAITQLILNLVEGAPILLVDGGHQLRCFTDVSEGVECLARLIDDRRGNCNKQILNIGNPNNEASIRELAEMLVEAFEAHPLRHHFPPFAGFREVESGAYYGRGYQDVEHRRPSIRNARRLVGWEPKVPLRESVCSTLDFFLSECVGHDAVPEIDVVAAKTRSKPRPIRVPGG